MWRGCTSCILARACGKRSSSSASSSTIGGGPRRRYVERGKLGGVDAARVEAACRAGFDGFSTLLGEVFGEKAWEELLNNVPDSWEEDEAIRSIADILRRPAVSETVWLLLPAQAVP